MKGHRWRRLCGKWPTYCVRCGLVKLNNPASIKAAKAPCEADYDDEEFDRKKRGKQC